MTIKNLGMLLVLSSAIVMPSIMAAALPGAEAPYVANAEENTKLQLLQERLNNNNLNQDEINTALAEAAASNQQAIVEFLLARPKGQLRPDQDGINVALGIAADRNQLEMVEFLLARPEGQLRPDQGGINLALGMAADGNQLEMVEFLLARPEGQLRPDQHTINMALAEAAASNQQAIVEFLLARPEGQLRPDQDGINVALGIAADGNHQAIVEFLLARPEGQLRPNQRGINDALRIAAYCNQLEMVEFLLARPEGQLRPNQDGINLALGMAADGNHQAIVEFLLARPEGQLRPDQGGINMALRSAADRNQLEMVEFLLGRPEGQRPNEAGIIAAYRGAMALNVNNIVRLLEPHVPLAEILNHRPALVQAMRAGVAGGPARGVAFEIHNYAGAQVNVHGDGSAAAVPAAAPKQMALIDAVFGNIQERLKNIPLIKYEDAAALIEKYIDENIPAEKRAQAKEAVLYRLGSDKDYEQQISLVVTFLQTFHLEQMGQWINGFAQESIEAYKGANSKSCQKGIMERIGTGLRGIDPELDKLFSQVEGPKLFNNWLAHTFGRSEPEMKELAKQLIAKGINNESKPAEIEAKLWEIVEAKLGEYGVSKEQIRSDVEAYIDWFKDDGNFELLRPSIPKQNQTTDFKR